MFKDVALWKKMDSNEREKFINQVREKLNHLDDVCKQVLTTNDGKEVIIPDELYDKIDSLDFFEQVAKRLNLQEKLGEYLLQKESDTNSFQDLRVNSKDLI